MYIYHYRNRLVVLTTEWLPWLHGLLYETSREVVSLFPLFFPYFRMRKIGGNNKETGCLIKLTSSTKVKHATRVATRTATNVCLH